MQRGRVAISYQGATETADMSLHLGHARTLLLGELICKERGIPFDVRIDAAPDPVAHEFVMDLANCLFFLGIRAERMYWPLTLPDIAHMPEVFREVVKTNGGSPNWCQMMDDAMNDHLIIRGLEFKDGRYFDVTAVAGAAAHVAIEDRLFALAGRTKHEVNVPLMMLGNQKFSKSRLRTIHWSILRALPAETARDFLVATALCPRDPLAYTAPAMPFQERTMSDAPYEWSWETWADLLRSVGKP
jgi:hypothetical protein